MKKYSKLSLSTLALTILLGASCTTTTPSINSNTNKTTIVNTTPVDYSAQLLSAVEYCLPDNQPKQLTMPTDQTTEWKQYDGNLFSLYYPANFTVENSLNSEYLATFVSPDGSVKFSVYAPYNSAAPAQLLLLETETVVAEDTVSGPLTCVTELGEAGDLTLNTFVVQANDSSYLRSIENVNLDGASSSVQTTFSFQYDTVDSFEQYSSQFNQFMNSLVRYADA